MAILRGQKDWSEKILPGEILAIPALSVGELVHGRMKSQHASAHLACLDVLLSAVAIFPYDEWPARHCVLLTHYQKHFARLTDLAGLKLEDWWDLV